ncbi:tyrosine-type recombinase/integrase [Yokenella regensburgei]|uniref:tyrosine-type recombinase/integrase n=1 Tax=Yokenella regensburgei TaxID=158877 RepID=UPI003ED95836
MLTDTKLRKSWGKKRDEVEVISDSHGLNARISMVGKITFFYRYRWAGKAAKLNVGEYPSMSIAQARERRQQFRNWLLEGVDPREQVKLERLNKVEALSVEQAFLYWIEKYCIPNGLTKIDYYRVVFKKHVSSAMAGVKVNNTSRRHWVDLFDGIESRVMAHYMLSLCKRVFRFCLTREVISVNPLEGMLPGDVGQKPKRKARRLNDDELLAIYSWLKNHMSMESKFLVKFIMLTGCRTVEIRTAKREWFNLKDSTWTIPASNYKMRVVMRRALCDVAIALLKTHMSKINTDHLVTSQRLVNGVIADKPVHGPVASNYARSIWKGTKNKEWSLHDLRRTLATTLSELGCPPHVVEKLLGHQMIGVMAHYNLHDYIDDQRHWLAVWQNHLEKIIGEPFR